MSNDSTDHVQEIAEAIQDLFGEKDSYVLMLGDNSLFGCDGIAGLRLLVNHLFDEIYGGDASAERHLMGSGRQPTKNRHPPAGPSFSKPSGNRRRPPTWILPCAITSRAPRRGTWPGRGA